MSVIDCHINISSNGSWFNTNYIASYENINIQTEEAGIEKAVLIAMPGACNNDYFYNDTINRDKFWIFGNIDFQNIDLSFKQIIELNLDGVKVHPRFQNVSLHELDELGVFTRLNDLALPLMICGWQQSSILCIKELCPLNVDMYAKKYTRIKFIISHLGGHKFWDAFTVARSNKNVFLDCSYFLSIFKNTSLEKDFFTILPFIDKKVFYGSDFPEVSILEYKDYFIKKIDHLTTDKVNNVAFDNINRFFNTPL
jgi:predicted TIM-barrel fold metal-dependent hydrolase